jgi:hypothetical protein
MKQLALVSFLTATLAVVGFHIGMTIHGVSVLSLIPALAGGLGGFGIGCASLDVARRWQASRNACSARWHT